MKSKVGICCLLTFLECFQPIIYFIIIMYLVKDRTRCIWSDVQSHDEFRLFPLFQSAYRKFHSTETALLRVQNDILMNINRHHVTLLVLLDLSAAFDTVDHKILLHRLCLSLRNCSEVVWIVLFQPIATRVFRELSLWQYQATTWCPSRLMFGTPAIYHLFWQVIWGDKRSSPVSTRVRRWYTTQLVLQAWHLIKSIWSNWSNGTLNKGNQSMDDYWQVKVKWRQNWILNNWYTTTA